MVFNELKAQKMVVDAVREHGGFGMKMSHKFLVGVPDLLLMPRDGVPSLWECKIRDILQDKNKSFKLSLTPLQKKFLKEFSAVGGVCGVISILRGKAELYMATLRYDVVSYGDADIEPWAVNQRTHFVLNRIGRAKSIYEIFMKGAYDASHQPKGD